MARYQVLLAYDGTDFQGFQRQKAARTVQGVVEEALRALGWAGDSILAAGRTDTGVHASGQVVTFDLAWDHSDEDLIQALNSNLPLDVAARSARQVAREFHPRYSALARRYQYTLFFDQVRQPLRERYAWRVWPGVNVQEMHRGARLLVGNHDFGAFGAPPKPGGSALRAVESAWWRWRESDLVFDIVANGFLYHMVRRLVSLFVEIGQGKRDAQVISNYLAAGAADPVQGLAPPHGLSLVEVIYGDSFYAEDVCS